MQFTRRQTLAFIAITICCLGIIIFSWFLVLRVEKQNWWIRHTLEVINEGQQSLTCLLDCETAARGYLITGEKEFLEPYETCYKHVAGHLTKLQQLTADNQAQQILAPQLFKLARTKIEHTQELIAGRKAIIIKPEQLAGMRPDKIVMDKFRAILGQVIQNEELLLKKRQAALVSLRSLVYILIALLSSSLLSVLIWIARSTAQENRTQIELAKSRSELQYNRSAFNAIVGQVKDYAAFLLDPVGTILTWNQGAQLIKGYSPDEIIGKNFCIFYSKDDQQAQVPQQGLQKAIKYGHWEAEGWRFRKDGSRFWAGVTITPISDQSGQLSGFIKLTRDLTERKKAQEAIEFARDEAIKANALKSQFVATISHEIRTPLSGVVGLAELLATDPKLDSEARDCAATMFDASKQLLTVLNDLLDFSKLEAGRIQIEQVPLRPKDILDEVLTLQKPKAQQKNLAVTVRLDASLPSYVIGDPIKIRQTLTNLIHNAIKFTEQGGIEISAEKQDGKMRFSVTDTGIGIPEEIHSKLFKPFTQADASTTRKFGGTGLGLSISKQYVELMGGDIGVSSEPNHGSTFWFVVPLIEATKATYERG